MATQFNSHEKRKKPRTEKEFGLNPSSIVAKSAAIDQRRLELVPESLWVTLPTRSLFSCLFAFFVAIPPASSTRRRSNVLAIFLGDGVINVFFQRVEELLDAPRDLVPADLQGDAGDQVVIFAKRDIAAGWECFDED